MNKKFFALIVSIITVVALIAVGTYAYWIWKSDVNKNVVFNTISGLEDYVVYDEGSSSFVGNFQATDTFCQSASTTISFYKKSELADVGLSATVYMDVNNIGDNISASNGVYWVVTTGDSSITCDSGLYSTSVVDYGTFNGVSAGGRITLLDSSEIKLTNQTYTVWIWINSARTDLSSLSGETIDTNVWTEISMVAGEAPTPELDDGMIPVTISADGTVTTVDKNDKEWYNYANKEWANAVLVTDSSRTNYVGTTDKTVAESDILAYYVWIPRYKYKIWTTTKSSVRKEQIIDIIFEDKDAVMSSGTTVGSYKTHPAFWWDDDSDGVVDAGEMIAGIWVGKFETTGNATTPTIKPNSAALGSQNVNTQFLTAQKFSADGNVYGLSNTSTNGHMMKNSEWGAVAYLSYSVYGINGEVRVNNYYVSGAILTGCGAATKNASQNNTKCEIPYGSVTDGIYPQSTTGNITGIYDMSGGGWEYVMGNYAGTIDNSGFSAMPNEKYYDKYSITATSSCTLATCGGHALYETDAWYGDYANFVESDYPWFLRGGYYDIDTSAGVFAFFSGDGDASEDFSWRSVLVIGFGE